MGNCLSEPLDSAGCQCSVQRAGVPSCPGSSWVLHLWRWKWTGMVARHISYHILQVFFWILSLSSSLSLSFPPFFFALNPFILFFLPSFPSPTLLPPPGGAGLGIERKEKGGREGEGKRRGEKEREGEERERTCLCTKPQDQS